jgi:hypothetical protein
LSPTTGLWPTHTVPFPLASIATKRPLMHKRVAWKAWFLCWPVCILSICIKFCFLFNCFVLRFFLFYVILFYSEL